MAFQGTAQERAIRLIATKLETSNAVEGKLAADGLSAMAEGTNSLMYDLARSIMRGDVEKANTADIWNSYRQSEKVKMQEMGVGEEKSQEVVLPIAQSEPKTISFADVKELWKTKGRQKGDATVLSVFDLLEELDVAV
jgi:hypothetical protein